MLTNPRGLTWSYTHDAAGRLTAETDFNGRALTYTRDAADSLITRTNGTGQALRFVLGALGRTVEQHDEAGSVTTFAYAPAGNPLSLRSSTGVLGFVHDAGGRETQRTLGPAATLNQTWNAAGLLTVQTLTAAPDRLLQHRTYAHRADGFPTEIREQTTGTRRFDLDGMGRATRSRAHGWSETYAYDPFGRRISKYRVRDDGSLDERVDFVWDDLCLAEQTALDGTVTTWDYAPDSPRPVAQTNHRAHAATGGVSFLAKLAEESDLLHSARFFAVITDCVGTPTELVFAEGEMVRQLRAGLWGTEIPAPDERVASVGCPLRFPGQYADPETACITTCTGTTTRTRHQFLGSRRSTQRGERHQGPDDLRAVKVGRIDPKGTEDISGDKWRRPPLASEGCK
ncbi:RHS repeat domain-containing protein [Streptomyces sp. NPDC006704]|uniref:RHS repeat domain-containing protein n=1 Tax=Streptomyces sp. NPDC006704 TaxID=3364760 RepID=UPI0036BB5641